MTEPFVVVDSTDSPKAVKVTISIIGMTCGTCVGKISEALEMQSWVRSVNVTLLTNSAVVTIQDKSHVMDILQSIEDLGYEATVEQIDEHHTPQETDRKPQTATLRASYSVGGMTCSSCIGAINGALKNFFRKHEYAYVLGNLYCVLLIGLGISHYSYAFVDFGHRIQPHKLF